MPLIEQIYRIKADIDIVFDLARSIDLHQISTAHTKEKAIAGKTSGLLELHEQVTWRAKHFGIYQNLTSEMRELKKPNYFVDEMVAGAFQSFRHEHWFESSQGVTVMTDRFDYRAPLGILGKCADYVFLKKYMETFLNQRNLVVKEFAESGRWKEVLPY